VNSYVHKQHDAAFLSEDLIHCFNKTQDKVKKKGSVRGVPVLQRDENYRKGMLEK